MAPEHPWRNRKITTFLFVQIPVLRTDSNNWNSVKQRNTLSMELDFTTRSQSLISVWTSTWIKLVCLEMGCILRMSLVRHLSKEFPQLLLMFFSDVSLLFSPAVLSWNKSKIGDVVSCVAVCEYCDDPTFVKVRKGEKNRFNYFPIILLSFFLLENAKNSDIPQSYLLITNNELVRVRYLMIYGSKKKAVVRKPSTSEEVELVPSRSFLQWCRKNPLVISVTLYVFLLFLVGFSNHRAVEYYKNKLWSFLKNRFKFLWGKSFQLPLNLFFNKAFYNAKCLHAYA